MIRSILIATAILIAATLPATAQKCATPVDAFFTGCQVRKAPAARPHKAVHKKHHKSARVTSPKDEARLILTDPPAGKAPQPVFQPDYSSATAALRKCWDEWENSERSKK